MNPKWTCRILALMATGLFGLVGCGGSSGDDGTGTLNIGLTDGPVDFAASVIIQFTGLELKPVGGPPETFDLNANSCDDYDANGYCSIDLLTLQGTDYRSLFVGNLPAGDYQWVRLLVNAEQNVLDSYVTFSGENEVPPMECSLYIPSGSETGLKIVSGMTVTANGVSYYMLDFDVRKSITAPPGLASPATECMQNYILKPAIRMVDETEVGSIAGMVNPDLLDGCRDEDLEVGVVDHLDVYVFEDFDGLATADDYDGEGDAITSAIVKSNDLGETYEYEVGYLLEGDYVLGLTCTPDVDVMPGQGGMVADNFDCDFTQADCEETDPAFDFIGELYDVSVVIGTVADGDFPDPNP